MSFPSYALEISLGCSAARLRGRSRCRPREISPVSSTTGFIICSLLFKSVSLIAMAPESIRYLNRSVTRIAVSNQVNRRSKALSRWARCSPWRTPKLPTARALGAPTTLIRTYTRFMSISILHRKEVISKGKLSHSHLPFSLTAAIPMHSPRAVPRVIFFLAKETNGDSDSSRKSIHSTVQVEQIFPYGTTRKWTVTNNSPTDS